MENLSVGASLSRARHAAGMSVDDVSQRIKLTAKQIELLENDGFDQLGLVFSRGFVRNYARLVGLDANALVQAIPNNTRNKSDPISIHDEHIPLTNGWSRHWLIVAAVTITLLVIVPLLVYHWLSGDDTRIKTALTNPSVKPKRAAAAQFVVQPAVSPLPARATTPLPTATATHSSTQRAAAIAASAALTTQALLQFQFAKDSWIEIRDAQHHIVLSHLYHAGETASLTEAPPLSLTIGDAANVKLSYNNHAVNITPHPPATVTKLTLP
ncbi:MAG: RodZ domain-containing protein [Sulfuriferula sp.]